MSSDNYGCNHDSLQCTSSVWLFAGYLLPHPLSPSLRKSVVLLDEVMALMVIMTAKSSEEICGWGGGFRAVKKGSPYKTVLPDSRHLPEACARIPIWRISKETYILCFPKKKFASRLNPVWFVLVVITGTLFTLRHAYLRHRSP